MRLEDILKSLNSEVARAEAVFSLKQKGVDVPGKFVDKALRYYEKTHNASRAARLAENSGRLKQAIEMYEKANSLDKAAELAEKTGDNVRAVRLYESLKNPEKAAEIAEKAGMAKTAIDLYRETRHFWKIIDIAKKNGMKEELISAYESIENYEEAADLAKQMGQSDRARVLYIKQAKSFIRGSWEYGISLAKREGVDKDKTFLEACEKKVQDLESEREFISAAKLAEAAGFKESAVKIYNRLIDLHMDMEHFEGALELSKKLGVKDISDQIFSKAMKTYQGSGRDIDAAKMAENEGNVDLATRLYLRAYQKAEGKSQYRAAIRAAEKLNNLIEANPLALGGAISGKDEEGEKQTFFKGFLEKAKKLARRRIDLKDRESISLKIKELTVKEIRRLERNRQYASASRFARESGLSKLGIELCEKAMKYAFRMKSKEHLTDAINTLKCFEMDGRTLGVYERFGIFYEAAKVAEGLGLEERAIKNYARAEDYRHAAKLSERIGNLKDAMGFYENAGDFEKAAGIAEKSDNPDKANSLNLLHRMIG